MVPIVTLGSLLCTDVTPFSSFCFNTRVPAYSWRCNSAPDGGSSPRHRVSLTPQPRGFPLFSQEVGQIWRSSTPGGRVWLAAHPTQKNHPALNLHPLHFLGVGDLGTESTTPRPCFLPPVPVHGTCARCAAGRGLPFNSTLLQPCGVLADPAGAGWAGPGSRCSCSRSCLALGLSDSQP